MGPFGTANGGHYEEVCIQKGKCSTDSLFFDQSEVRTIAQCALDSMNRHIQASFFWTAHNEIEAKWDYVRAWDMAFINKT